MEKCKERGLDNPEAGGYNYLCCIRYDITQKTPALWRMGGIYMAEIRIKENESLDSALRRFKKQCARAGVIQEVRKREAYEKPSVKRKKKSEAARKRKYK